MKPIRYCQTCFTQFVDTAANHTKSDCYAACDRTYRAAIVSAAEWLLKRDTLAAEIRSIK